MIYEKEKYKRKKREKKDSEGLAAERILAKNNQDVLNYVDGINNITEKENVIRELIDYLNNCLLDRDAGNPGPKLIDQLKERIVRD